MPVGGVLSNPSFFCSTASDCVLVTIVVSSTVCMLHLSLWLSSSGIVLNAASESISFVSPGVSKISPNLKLNISSISTENADSGDGKSKSKISEGVDRLECESDCFSVVKDEQDIVDPCLISSHNLCNSSVFRSMPSIFLQKKDPGRAPMLYSGSLCLAMKSQTKLKFCWS